MMSEHEEDAPRRKKETYGSLWHELTTSAEAAGLDFIVNGGFLSAEVSFFSSGHRVAAHLLKEGGLAWFVGNENVAVKPPSTELIDKWVASNLDDLKLLLSFVKSFTSDDVDYAKYRGSNHVEGESTNAEVVEPVEAKVAKKAKEQTKKANTKKSSTRAD